MIYWRAGGYALGICAIAVFAGCGGGGGNTPLSPSPAAVTAEPTKARQSYSVLYSFKGEPDGAYPKAGLLNVDGTLYGTTVKGGGAECECGTVFTITPSGAETVLRSFTGGKPDGKDPSAPLLNVDGALYGTTVKGGAYREGTVFEVTMSGDETVLHSFGRAEDGHLPRAGLIDVKGTLYGTTWEGGADGGGTVFSITTSGKERVLHSFSNSGDGNIPYASLINVNGTLYGTTSEGGTLGGGTVFSITLSGKETVLHNFGGSGDGDEPVAGLATVGGTLYGTTPLGGANRDGTVFSITPSGKETVLHSFPTGSGDGRYPEAGLLNVNGTLYGTTIEDEASGGPGTVFSITTSGKETVLHTFPTGSGDGEFPYAGLINVNGTLYGTTAGGGAYHRGTVFSLSP